MSKKIIYIPKPEWWGNEVDLNYHGSYREALEAASKASGILFTLEDEPPLYDTH